MPCTFCRGEVLESGKTWGFHHHKLSQFHKSLEDGCTICLRLADDLEEIVKWVDEDGKREDAVYRWTLRKAATLRESDEVAILRLRPSIDGNTKVKNWEQRSGLPDRTFYLIPDEDLGRVPEARDFGKSTNSAESFSQISRWVSNCTKNHAHCRRRHNAPDFVPKRLIDVGSSQSPWPEFFPIVETKAHHIHNPYVTLSHSWGPPEKPFVELHKSDTDDNYQRFTTEGISREEMETNQNFVHAIEVARKMNIRYLWIDSLCIIQRQPGKEDWLEEGVKMHQVYRNSFCNIAAVDSGDKDGGLFRSRDQREILKMVPSQYTPGRHTFVFGKRRWRVVSDHIYEGQLMDKILYTRGWVFQERLLSPRLLHFSRTQVFWDCATTTACEAIPLGLPLAVDSNSAMDRHWRSRLQEAALIVRPIGDASLEEFWHSAVRTYTSCDLGFQSDKIKAIWGVAKLVRDALGEDFADGIWTLNVAEQLCWKVVKGRQKNGGGERPSDLKSFPSWSWASVRGTIEVGRRIATTPRWWTAQGPGGEKIHFELKERIFPRVGKGQNTWRQELVFMDEEIAKMEARAMEIATKLRRERNALAVSVGVPKHGNRRVNLDAQPELSDPAIRIQAHVMQGVLKKRRSAIGWVVSVASETGDGHGVEAIQAFPDVIPEQEESACEFTFLCVSRMVSGEWSSHGDGDDEYEEEEIEMAEYTGIGIMLKRTDGDKFERAGALAFEELPQQVWTALRSSCCGGKWDPSTNGEHALEDGQQFCLY